MSAGVDNARWRIAHHGPNAPRGQYPAPRGRQPTWGGYIPQLLGFHICQKILEILTTTDTFGYLNPTSQAVLEEQRQARHGIIEPYGDGMEDVGGEIFWWAFAGGRINSTMRHAIASIGPNWRVVNDNYLLRIRDDNLMLSGFQAVRQQLCDPTFWDNEALWQQIAASLPNYRLSKFQPLMPPWIEREVVANYLLDVRGARQWLAR